MVDSVKRKNLVDHGESQILRYPASVAVDKKRASEAKHNSTPNCRSMNRSRHGTTDVFVTEGDMLSTGKHRKEKLYIGISYTV